jgi:hypothetical protein
MIMKVILSIVFCCLACVSYAQDKTRDKALDQLINQSTFGKAALIFLKNGIVFTDSMPVKKIDHFRKDSLVHIKFRDNRSLQIPKEEFWGLVTDYNERRRFYKNETYIVWRTTAPYIYKDMKHRNDNRYFFSESLTGTIYPLLATNIEPIINDKAQQDVLKTFVTEHKIGQVFSPAEPGGNTGSKADLGAVIGLVSEIIYIFAGDHGRSINDQKQRIQNDPQYKSQFPDTSVYR